MLLTAPIIVGKGPDAQKSKLDRHSKPYFLHVDKIDDNKFQGSILCLPYNYLMEHPNFDITLSDSYDNAIKEFNTKLGLIPY